MGDGRSVEEAWTSGDRSQPANTNFTLIDYSKYLESLPLAPSTAHCIRVCNIMSSVNTPDRDALITELSKLTSIPPQEVYPLPV